MKEAHKPRPGLKMTLTMIRRRKAGQRTLGQTPVRPLSGTLSGVELRRLVAEMVD